MTIPPSEAPRRDRAGLTGFLEQCRLAARRAGHWKIASISLEVKHIDPLLVLETIYEPGERHFYLEQSRADRSLAGAEAVVEEIAFGPERWDTIRAFADEVFEHTLSAGDVGLPFSGPHLFAGFAFLDRPEPGGAFEAATAFLPRWQVSQSAGTSVAVANLRIDAETRLEPLIERTLAAHEKFQAFDYAGRVDAEKRDRDARREPAPLCWEEVGPAARYEDSVREALRRIRRGAYDKIVLARAREAVAEVGELRPLLCLDDLRQRFPECFAFSYGNGRGESFIGATPERLAAVRDGRLITEALAGSAPRGGDRRSDSLRARALLASDKDLREHRHVIASIMRRLEEAGFDPRAEVRPSLLRLANVFHLRTAIEAPAGGGRHLLDALAALHPTPAVGGKPRRAAVPDIRELEGFDRGLYTGTLGWLDAAGGGEFVVGLRSALIDGARAVAYAGAGIVEGSDPEREKAETDLKFEAIIGSLR